MQDAETGEVEGIVGKGHASTDIRLHVFEQAILELTGWFENCDFLRAAPDGSKFISMGISEAQDMVK
jgi:hypothetical protein